MEHAHRQLPDLESDPYHSKERLVEAARQLARQSAELLRQFQNGDEDLMPCIVSGASGMQELIDDLLAYSRYADVETCFAISPQSPQAEGICLD